MEKRISFIVFVLILISNGGFVSAVQTKTDEFFNKSDNRFHLGIEGGVNAITLRGNDSVSNYCSVITGNVAGFSLGYHLKNNCYVVTGVSYERKGTSFEIPVRNSSGARNGTIEGRHSFDYLIIPLLFKINYGNRFKYFIYGGGYYGLVLKEKDRYDGPGINFSGKERMKDFKKSDTGVSGGLGISYTTKKLLVFTIDFRNNFGLTDISTTSSHLGGTVRTYSTDFLIALSFPLSK